MEHNAIESFISFCDEMCITQEGKIFDKIKSKFTKDKKDEERKSMVKPNPTLKKASSSDFKHLYNTDALCAEGLKNPDSEDTMNTFTQVISKWEGCPEKLNFYYCFGKDLNDFYYLTGDNKYPDNLGIFFIDWSNFGKEFKASSHKGKFRWFSDVVDNNARREIQKGNTLYENYHSKYGDKWFYDTI